MKIKVTCKVFASFSDSLLLLLTAQSAAMAATAPPASSSRNSTIISSELLKTSNALENDAATKMDMDLNELPREAVQG